MSHTFIFLFFLGGCGQCLSWSGQTISHIFPWESHKKSSCSPQSVNHFHSFQSCFWPLSFPPLLYAPSYSKEHCADLQVWNPNCSH